MQKILNDFIYPVLTCFAVMALCFVFALLFVWAIPAWGSTLIDEEKMADQARAQRYEDYLVRKGFYETVEK